MGKLFLALLIYCCVFSVESHAVLTKSWDFRYGGQVNDVSKKLYETLDHGFLVCGTSYSGIGFDKTDSLRGVADFWIVKTDSVGSIIWDKTFGGMRGDDFTCAVLLPDSGYLLGGTSSSNIGGEKSQNSHDSISPTWDYWIIKIDKLGNKIWDKTFGGNFSDWLSSIVVLPDGSFLLAGTTESSNNGDMTHHNCSGYDYWVVKIDSTGMKLWDQNYGGSYNDKLVTAVSTSDKGFILGGISGSPAGCSKTQNSINNSDDYWILKIDSNGVKLWDKTLGGDGTEIFCTLNILPGDKLLLGGISTSNIGFDKSIANHVNGVEDYWFVRTDSLGNKIWDMVYGGNDREDDLNNVVMLNGGFMISGTSYSSISGDKSENNILNAEQAWLLAIDTGGNKMWDITLNTVMHMEFCYGLLLHDSCLAIMAIVNIDGGDVSQVRNSSLDYWLAKYCMNNSLPVASFTANSTALCQNTCIDFTNLSTNASSYQWFFSGGTPSSSIQSDPQGICYYHNGTFGVTLVAGSGNGYDTLTIPQYVTVYPQVPFTPITQVGDTLFSVPGYASYQWYSDSLMISGAGNYFYVAQHSGNYSVIVTDSNGCFATAYKTNVIASTNDLSLSNTNINLFSSAGKIILKAENLQTSNSRLIITNSLGEIVFEKNLLLRNGMNEISAGDLNLARGIYIAVVQNSEQVYYSKILIN